MSDLCVGFHPLVAEQPLLEVRLIDEESGEPDWSCIRLSKLPGCLNKLILARSSLS